MVYRMVWVSVGSFQGLSKYEGPYFHAPKLQNQHKTSNIQRIEGYPYGPANDPQSIQPFDMNRRSPLARIPCFIGYIVGSTSENSVFQHWRYLRILPRLETGVVGAIKHIFHTAVKYSK